MTDKIGWDELDESLQNYLHSKSRDAMRALRDVGILQNRLTAEIALVKAMCNAVDWDTAEAKGVGVALHGGSGRPAEPDVKEPEEAPVRDFPCCDSNEHAATAADIGERFEVDASNVTRFITNIWCPYTGKTNVVTVHFKTGAPPICLACGFHH